MYNKNSLPSLKQTLDEMNDQEKKSFYANLIHEQQRAVQLDEVDKKLQALKNNLVTKDGEALRQQTEMFWLLQLQFLSAGRFGSGYFKWLRQSELYKPNSFTKKIDKIIYDPDYPSEDDFACLCTHFALQLAGVEE